MSAITAIVRTNMAAMAHVFLAHLVRSIHIEKDTKRFENLCGEKKTLSQKVFIWLSDSSFAFKSNSLDYTLH